MEIEIKTSSTSSARFINYGKTGNKVKYLYEKPYKTFNYLVKNVSTINKITVDEVKHQFGEEIKTKYLKYLNNCVDEYLKTRIGFLLMITNYDYSFKKNAPFIKEFDSRYGDYYNPEFGGIETIQYDKNKLFFFMDYKQNVYLNHLKRFFEEKTYKDGEYYSDYRELLCDIENELLKIKTVTINFTNDKGLKEQYTAYFYPYANKATRENIYLTN